MNHELLILASLQFRYPQSLPWVILLIAALSLLILLAYPAQLRQLPRSVRGLPPALRILAVTAIALSILRPVVTRARIAGERAPVLIIIDNSRSMSMVDSTRPPGEWVGIAAAMGRLPADARDRQITAVQADCDRLSAQADDVSRARAELDYAKLSGRGIEAAQAKLDQAISDLQAIARDANTKALAVKRMGQLEKTLAYLVRIPAGMDRDVWLDRMREKARAAASDAEMARLASDSQLFQGDAKIRDACQPLQSLSRLQISESAVFDSDNGLIARLGSDTSVKTFGVSDQVTPLGNFQFASDPLPADGTSTNLTGGLRAILDSMKAAPPRAVVLFSDGKQVSADNDPATIAAIGGIPIFTVSVPARSGFKDLSIANVQVNSTATVGEMLGFKVELHAQGMNSTSSELTFSNGTAAETRRIAFPDNGVITQNFYALLKQPGPQRFAFDLDGVPGEASYENNHTDRWITVLPAGKHAPITKNPATRPTAEAEMADLGGDESWLRHLAETSGGQPFRLDQVDLLPRRLAEVRDDVSHPIEVPLWDGSYLFVLVLGCLAAEWGIRKRYGLA